MLVGITLADLKKAGITHVAKTKSANGCSLLLEDGQKVEDIGAVIWATGFRNDFKLKYSA